MIVRERTPDILLAASIGDYRLSIFDGWRHAPVSEKQTEIIYLIAF